VQLNKHAGFRQINPEIMEAHSPASDCYWCRSRLIIRFISLLAWDWIAAGLGLRMP
jgi:hypothetical protein